LEWNRQFLDVFPFAFTELGKFALLAFHDGTIMNAAAEQQSVFMVRDGPPVAAPVGTDAVGPVSQFLLETLISAQRLYRHHETNYIGLRKWRTAIKPHQIAALRALKTEPSEAFVTAVAAEMAGAIRSVYGTVESCVVVPVPCGSSGPDCFTCRLATAVAAQLGIAKVEAFAPIATPRGSSHPRRNIRRPAMKLLQPVNQSVILIDDVVTSGSHIDEAATLLRASAPQVWPVAWIAS
jgi:hypoxanthine-guanine phosphoribosyltransferase